MITEAEARTQTCPLIKYCVNEAGVIQDGHTAIYVHQNCQASACRMGWRWAETIEPLPADDTSVGMYRELALSKQPRTCTHGYCGAFGEPK